MMIGFWGNRSAEAYQEAVKALFNAYSWEGEKFNERLVIDYDFFFRPGVKMEMKKLIRDYTMDIESLLKEFDAHSSKSEKEEFVKNIEYFYLCFIKRAVKFFGLKELLNAVLVLRKLLEMRLTMEG